MSELTPSQKVREQILGVHPWLNPTEVDKLEQMILQREVDMRNEFHAKVRANDKYWIDKIIAERAKHKEAMTRCQQQIDAAEMRRMDRAQGKW